MLIAGTLEGLMGDVVSKLGSWIQNDIISFPESYYAERIYLTGQSQSGMYLNTYVYFLPKYITDIFEDFMM